MWRRGAPQRVRRVLTLLSARSTSTAHTLVAATVSTTGTPPATASEERGVGSARPGGGRRNCRLTLSVTNVILQGTGMVASGRTGGSAVAG